MTDWMKTNKKLFSLSLCPAVSLLILLVPGCIKETKPVALVNRSPLIVDDAMQQRKWPVTVVHFQNGETPAWPTEFALEHPADEPKLLPILTDGPLFLANVFAMPFDIALNPPWERVIYPAGVAEPSYTGIPPVPPKVAPIDRA